MPKKMLIILLTSSVYAYFQLFVSDLYLLPVIFGFGFIFYFGHLKNTVLIVSFLDIFFLRVLHKYQLFIAAHLIIFSSLWLLELQFENLIFSSCVDVSVLGLFAYSLSSDVGQVCSLTNFYFLVATGFFLCLVILDFCCELHSFSSDSSEDTLLLEGLAVRDPISLRHKWPWFLLAFVILTFGGMLLSLRFIPGYGFVYNHLEEFTGDNSDFLMLVVFASLHFAFVLLLGVFLSLASGLMFVSCCCSKFFYQKGGK